MTLINELINSRVASACRGASLATMRLIESRLYKKYSKLYIISDGAAWVLREEANTLYQTTRRLGVPSAYVANGSIRGIKNQGIFLTSQFMLKNLSDVELMDNRVALSYFHGHPNPEYPEFEENLLELRRTHKYLFKVHVSCSKMETLLINNGVPKSKIQRIPIGVELEVFKQQTKDSRHEMRARLGIPHDAVVIGSFQKDGVGWGDGSKPKLIKGPDILVDVLALLVKDIPHLHVLLSGPARGYVVGRLKEYNIPYTHVVSENYHDVASLYHAADLTMITSREEGGPKAVLESMSTGVPVLSTRVGQAADLIQTAVNGWLCEIEDVTGLTECAKYILTMPHNLREIVVKNARTTACQHDKINQDLLWQSFFNGMIQY